MLLLYYTNTILFWIGLPSFNPHDGLAKNLHKHDFQYLPQEVCIAQCLERNALVKSAIASVVQLGEREFTTKTPLEVCVSYCSTLNSTIAQNASSVKRVHENYSLNLICRDESSLNFKINLHTLNEGVIVKNKTKETDLSSYPTEPMSTAATSSPPTPASSSTSPAEDGRNNGDVVLFVIKIHQSNETENYFVFLSDDNFFTINKLAPNTTYNISAMAVHSSNKYSVIALEQQFQTLRRAYTPGNVTDIKVTDFAEDKDNRMHLSAMVTWKPPPDMTCHYDVICFSPESTDYDLQPLEMRNPRLLYKYQLENLTFSSVYKVGIRAMNTRNMKESELFWKTFRAPSCVQWHNYNFNICAPDAPTNLQIEQTYSNQNVYSFNISWNIPTHLPDNYTLSITDLSPQGRREVFNISKDVHSFFIDRITIYGILYEVGLTASTVGGSATSALTDVTKTIVHIPEKNHFVKLIATIMAPIFCVAILSMTVFIVYHRRAKLKRYQERCKYFEELEKKAPIDPKDNFDFAHTLNSTNKQQPDDVHYALDTEDVTLFNDEMEIVRSQLTLHEVLGEGAFGLVKRGIYKDATLGTSYEVAVKMLKDHPTADDVRAFRREIEVMKSVEKHPNIVGLIGHCTRFSNDMMLLTEYCSFGNLLDFLRDEWRFLHDIQRRRKSFPSVLLDIELPPVPVPARGSPALCELNVCPEDAMPSPPPPPPPPPNHPPASGQPPTVDNNGTFFKEDKRPEAWQNNNNKSNQLNSCDNINMINNNNCNDKDKDNRVDNAAAMEDNSNINCKLAIKRFKKKYNDLNRHAGHHSRSNSGKSNASNDNDGGNNGNWSSSRDQVVDIGSTHLMDTWTTSTSRGTALVSTTATHVAYNHRQVPTPPMTSSSSSSSSSTVVSPATDNMSYGYHGCCTNSCKCNVDVIIRNIDSSDASKDNEELDRLLQQQQQQQSNKTTIAIKNCDCRHQEQKQHRTNHPHPHRHRHTPDADENHKHKSAVENKTYFKMFNTDKHSNSTRKQQSLIAGATTSDVTATTNTTATTTTTSLAMDDAWHTANRVPLTSGDLLDIARQVALGMDFLAKNKVVHRDLAARNVLVAPDRTIKIADFGLSRDVYQENIYKKTGNGKLPIKWLALESLTHQVYTTKSDVWSYGILLYEIVTLGATPYPSIPTNRLLHLLKTGYRMEKPKNCSQEFYDLMYSCWNGTPNNRPTFCEIISKLKEMLNTLQQTSTSSAASPSSPPLPEASAQDDNVRRRNEDIENDNELSRQESPIQHICSDDSYLKPL